MSDQSKGGQVRRYEMTEIVRGMESWYELLPHENGEYVEFADYDSLSQERDRLRQRESDLEEDLARVRGHANVLAMDLGREREQLSALQAKAERLRDERDALQTEAARLREALDVIARTHVETADPARKLRDVANYARAALASSAAKGEQEKCGTCGGSGVLRYDGAPRFADTQEDCPDCATPERKL